ncbi:hypothetical protein I4U23_006829 [Adineta vaga]|nr:hypothetical protein I4U23_006829 [Adineta vaga]
MEKSSTINSTIINEIDMLSSESLNIVKDTSQIDLENYYINYVDDSNDQSESSAFHTNENITSVSVSKVISPRVEIFTNENIRCEFECIIHEYDPEVLVSYSDDIQRVYLTFSDPILAFQVCTYMNEKEFHGKKLSMSFVLSHSSTIEYLKPPESERIYMQSPPTTPPVGWVAKREELPEINFDLFLALSKLQPNEPLEILPKQNHLPAIVIHPCSDTSDDENDIRNSIIDEFGHKKYSTIEAKRRAHVLHDAILIPGEKHIRPSAGDGDNIIS